ncbi:hypothetical protein KFU94_18715 [Chloroflexi bacterium TSY]|nr:hypothetical protein [Chloroflexi bacterium TSY]
MTATHLFQSPLLRTDEPPTTQEACLSQTRRQVTFDFYGYVNNDDGSTTLTFGVTNGHRRALDAIVFPSNGWTRQSPAKNTRYTGDAGTYRVQWIPRNTRRQEAFRLRPQGNWFRNGASDRFTVTVTDFDPTKLFAAWVQSRNRWVQVHGRLAKHECDKTPPPATPTPPFSPLPTPTPTPEGGVVLPTEPRVAQCVFDGDIRLPEPIPLDRYSFAEPTIV